MMLRLATIRGPPPRGLAGPRRRLPDRHPGRRRPQPGGWVAPERAAYRPGHRRFGGHGRRRRHVLEPLRQFRGGQRQHRPGQRALHRQPERLHERRDQHQGDGDDPAANGALRREEVVRRSRRRVLPYPRVQLHLRDRHGAGPGPGRGRRQAERRGIWHPGPRPERQVGLQRRAAAAASRSIGPRSSSTRPARRGRSPTAERRSRPPVTSWPGITRRRAAGSSSGR